MFLQLITVKKICTGTIISAMAFTNLGWSAVNVNRKDASLMFQDTIPEKNRSKNYVREPKGIDEQIEQLDKAMEKLEQHFQGKNFEEMQQNLEESISKMDVAAMQKKVDEVMKKVDFDKLQLEYTDVIKKVDMQKMQQDLQKAMEEVKNKPEMKKLQQQFKESIKEAQKSIEEVQKVDYKKLQQELEISREQWKKERVNIEKEIQEAKKEIMNNKGTLEKELSEAKDEIKNTREELMSYKTMITLMDKEGLLNSKDDYTIEYHDGALTINGNKQTQEISDHYKAYLKKDNISIKNEKGHFSINIDDKK